MKGVRLEGIRVRRVKGASVKGTRVKGMKVLKHAKAFYVMASPLQHNIKTYLSWLLTCTAQLGGNSSMCPLIPSSAVDDDIVWWSKTWMTKASEGFRRVL